LKDPSSLNLKIVELAEGVSGPYCGRILAGFGARVLKIELPFGRGGDSTRNAGPFKDHKPGPDRSGLFAYLNANKLGVTLDVRTKDGFEILSRLVADQDLVILSGPESVVSHEQLVACNPQIVSVTLSPYGESGPYRNFAASELTMQALGGVAGRTGLPEREPIPSGALLSQFIAGANAISVSLAAVSYARKTGKGCHIDLSTFESVVQFLQGTMMKWSFERTVVKRGAQSRAANTIYPCADGYVGIFAPGSGTAWRNAAEVMEEPALADERFKTRALRSVHVDELDALILPWTLEHTKDEIYHRSQAAGLPFGPVRTAADVLGAPHHRERAFVRTTEHPVIGLYESPGMPFRVSGLEWRDGAAPSQGRDTDEVLVEGLGVPQETMDKLRRAEVA
jgi:CoA:oxalate CoA-transferase